MIKSAFDVRSKSSKLIRHAYSVREIDGYLQFLTYDFDTWIWMNLKDFVPIDFPIEK